MTNVIRFDTNPKDVALRTALQRNLELEEEVLTLKMYIADMAMTRVNLRRKVDRMQQEHDSC
jgi:hypothetical protein